MAEGERNLAVKIRFLGAAYHGFQRQKNAFTVQQLVEEALEKILGGPCVIFGCSRTDTGVSASEYVFNFRTENRITPDKLKNALNFFLPNDVAVLDTAAVSDGFHARYSTVGKEYKYVIRNSRQRDPFCEGRAYRYPIMKLDADALDREAQAFLGQHDFSAFCSGRDGVKSHVRTVTKAEVRRNGEDIVFTFGADGFLYNMVRIMVGTLLFTAEGKIEKGSVSDIIQSRDRKRAGPTANACGLYLNKVFYENDPFKKVEGSEKE